MIKQVALALSLTFVSIGGALAVDGCTTAGVNYREGPSTEYYKRGTVKAWTIVEWDRGECTSEYGSRWCHIYWNGYDGWVAAKYLSDDIYYCQADHYVPPKKKYVAPKKKYYAPPKKKSYAPPKRRTYDYDDSYSSSY